MWRACRRFLTEERASVPITDTFFLMTILMIGSVAGLVAMQRTVINEMAAAQSAPEPVQQAPSDR